jgi:hypothetical protein
LTLILGYKRCRRPRDHRAGQSMTQDTETTVSEADARTAGRLPDLLGLAFLAAMGLLMTAWIGVLIWAAAAALAWLAS